MKTIVMIGGILLTTATFGQKAPKFKTVKIKTSAQCGDCEVRIEDGLNYLKGIKYAELDNDTKIVEVKFKTSKLTQEDIKKKLNSIGYSADEMKATPEQIAQLPKCCQPGGHD